MSNCAKGWPTTQCARHLDPDLVTAAYQRKLVSRRAREVHSGTTLYGPHRDDLRLLTNGRDLRLYGSRGQQRSAALALKLAEVRVMTVATGAAPLLLLDDVMSELDAQRRATLLSVLDGVEQAILTTTDWEDFTPTFRARAQQLHVSAGSVVPFLSHDEPMRYTSTANTPNLHRRCNLCT